MPTTALFTNSSTLNDPVSVVVRQLCIDIGLAKEFTDLSDTEEGTKGKSSDWPIYTTTLPPLPPSVITVIDQEGVKQDRLQSGKTLYYRGVQFLVRSDNFTIGYRKANQILITLTESIKGRTVVLEEGGIDETSYELGLFISTSDVVPLGKQSDADNSVYVFSVNMLVQLNQYEREITEDQVVPTDPGEGVIPPTDLSGIEYELLATTTSTGKRIWKISHPTLDVVAHSNKSTFHPFTADSKYLSLYTDSYHALNLESFVLSPLFDRTVDNNLNSEVVWDYSGSRYYEIAAGNKLQRRQVETDAGIQEITLPSSIPYHGGGSATNLVYSLLFGSNEENVALRIHDTVIDEHAVQFFNPSTLELETPWWVKEASDAGVLAGSCMGSATFVTEPISWLDGLVGRLNTSSSRYHWIPKDGSTAVEVENAVFVSGSYDSDTGSSFRNPGYRRDLQIAGIDENTFAYNWGSPPTVNRGNRTQLWQVDNATIAGLFSEVDPTAIQSHYFDIGTDIAVGTFTHDNSPSNARDTVLVSLALTDGTITELVGSGSVLYQDEVSGPVLSQSRTSIDPNDKYVICHQYGTDGLTFVYLFEL